MYRGWIQCRVSVHIRGCGNILVINRRRAVSGRQIISAPMSPIFMNIFGNILEGFLVWPNKISWNMLDILLSLTCFHLKFSKASNWSTNYISTTSDDQIWPDSYRKISVCLAKVLCVHETVEKLNTATKVVLCIASTFAPPMPEVAPLQQFGAVFLVSNLWQCWHLGQPNSGQSRVTPNHRHYKSPKTSRRTPFCHNPNPVAIMAMTNRPQCVPL